MKFFWLVLAFLLSAIAAGQTTPTLTFTAQTTTGAGSVVPVLTWATTPAATTCTASGDWSGVKAAAGTQTLAAIATSQTYQMICTWPGDTTATLTWTPPTRNTNGTTLAKCASQTATGPCLRSYIVHEGPTDTTIANPRTIDDRNAVSYAWTGLSAGPHYFGVKAVNGDGVASALSNVATKTITTTQSVTRSIAITVNPQPEAPVLTVD